MYEGRLYRRIPVYLQYTSAGGLCNQLYAHLSVFTVATALNATVMVPPSFARTTFSHQPLDKQWYTTTPDTILDTRTMSESSKDGNVSFVVVSASSNIFIIIIFIMIFTLLLSY
ncbi:MAG: hypothetical protein J3K34DRAFT_450573 [Monoraphidium minutum]|nr:MAG: hypothetical protein J3K34DRAFT_450573 [Monoraphidium minutum]